MSRISVAPTAPPRFAFVGNHLPRRCGIATFTTDLCRAVGGAAPTAECMVVALNDAGHHHFYPDVVRFEIEEGEVAGYRRAAQFLNTNYASVVSLQHEYGIFGGTAGSNVITLLRELRVPVVTTLHTILTTPSAEQRDVLDEVIALSQRVVVMSAHGRETLKELHGVPDAVIDVIPHGIPIPVRGSPGDRLGFGKSRILLTFGLLSPDKGLEYVIDALPAILRDHPDTIFVVVGATHPHVKERHGEAYRLSLTAQARRLGVSNHVSFQDRFVNEAELANFMAIADVYITPYLNAQQSTSGTLTRAVAAGKAVVSTPYWHARELLAGDRGVLVPPRDAAALAQAVSGLLADDARRAACGQRASELGRSMSWPVVAGLYLDSFDRARTQELGARRSTAPAAIPTHDLPELNLEHLQRLTDDTGLLQHATFATPRYSEGYCLDDNARALLLTALLEPSGAATPKIIRELATRYLAFVAYAFNARSGRFRNFMTYTRQWSEDPGSEDSHGRAVWGLGATIGRTGDPGLSSLAASLFHAALPAIRSFTSPRAWAYGLLGIDEYLRAFDGDSSVQAARRELVAALLGLYERSSSPDWPWFEHSLSYANARLAQALIVSGQAMGSEEAARIGLESLEWLAKVHTSQREDFAPVGSNGFYARGGVKAEFDQQPLEAGSMVCASLDALRVTGKPIWAEHACRAFDWFLGRNHLERSLYDAATGGCRDGLHADRINENQGAESTLTFLIALVQMRSTGYGQTPRARRGRP